MQVQLSYDQRARLELLAIHAGKSTEQLLLDAAELLLEQDSAETTPEFPHTQRFLSAVELEARFERLLRQ